MKNFKKIMELTLAGCALLSMTACGSSSSSASAGTETASAESSSETVSGSTEENADGSTYSIGICNYVDDASLNQIIENIESQLKTLGDENNVTFDVKTENCNADSNVLTQIISNFEADQVDLMVGVATPVAMAMQSATEDSQTPVVFAAVSDPVSCGIVDSLEKPGKNITGTSDYLDTSAIMNLIFAADPDASNIALLYDMGQDSSKTAIDEAKAYLDDKGVKYTEYTGTNVSEVQMAVSSMIADGVDAVFTPSDNTIMTAELSIYEDLANAGIPHYTGADSFALNGAFLGYGVDYANLGVETADTIYDILVNGASPADTAVKTFDNGTATINTETCEALGYDLDSIEAVFEPLCTKVAEITTAESFE